MHGWPELKIDKEEQMQKFVIGISLEHNVRHTITNTFGTEDKKFSDKDKNKAIKRTDSGAMVLCEEGDEIEGFVDSIEPATVDGLSHGGCVMHASQVRMYVTGEGLNFGDYVVSGVQAEPGKSNVKSNFPLNQYGTTVVKKGNPVNFKWRVIRKDARDPNLCVIEAV